METFDEDSNYILTKIGLNESIPHLDLHYHSSSGGSTSDLARTFYSKMPHDLIENLYESYRFDFELFDYEYKSFLI